MSDILKTGLRLFIITVIAAVCMGITNLATQEPIRMQQIKAMNEAKRAVLPQAEEFSEVNILADSAESDGAKILEINAGKSGNEIVGHTFKISANGYGGDIEIIVGINAEGKIEAVQIGAHGETPGLGAKVKEKSFVDQYHGKEAANPLSVTKTSAMEHEIQAVTGATVSSSAVTNGVNLASEYYREVLNGGGQQ